MNLNVYPQLTEYLRNQIGFEEKEMHVFFNCNNSRLELPLEQIERDGYKEIWQIKENFFSWDPNSSDFQFTYTFRLKKTKPLFSRRGIASPNDVLGLALLWNDQKSQVRGVQDVCTFTRTDGLDKDEVQANISIAPKILRDTFDIRLILYMKEASQVGRGRRSTSTISGSLLGVLKEFTFKLEQDESLFPIREVEKNGSALWWVECNFYDDQNTPFDKDSFCLYLNKSHPDYVSLVRLQSDRNTTETTPMMKEIMASVLLLFITKAIRIIDKASLEQDDSRFPQGSIIELLSYYYKTLDLPVYDEIENLSRKIREVLF